MDNWCLLYYNVEKGDHIVRLALRLVQECPAEHFNLT